MSNTTLYVYSPSSTIIDKGAFARGLKTLKGLGYDVILDPDVKARHLRFAGDDATRLRAIERAAASGADIAIVSRGGYGLTRLLPHLPYDAIEQSVQRGMKWVGFSDFTAFQAAVYSQRRCVTWAGPSIGADFGYQDPKTSQPDDIMLACFEDLVCGQGEGVGWRLPKTEPALQGGQDDMDFGRGTVWGGNLCVLASLLGSPYFPKIKGGVLWLEDVAEHPYRVERLLTQLLHAGILDAQRAIVLGRFTDYTTGPADGGFKLSTVVQWLAQQTQVPILTGLPFGHVPTKVILPFGLKAHLTRDGCEALAYWG
jgi:muramoyltetrapeptide carboxypeptidase